MLANSEGAVSCGISEKEAERIIFGEGVDSRSRMRTIIELYPRMERTSWLRILGYGWESCDVVSPYKAVLKDLLGTNGPLMEMMEPTEIARYKELPNLLTVFRGAGRRNRNGASWTFERSIAERFLKNYRYYVPDPTLYTGRVAKQRILAIKLGREEAEVVTFSARIASSEQIVDVPM